MKKILLAAALAAVSSTAFAGSHTDNLTVKMEVVEECTISANDVAFGNLGILNRAYTGSGSVEVICTPNLAYTVGLEDAADAAAPFAMTSGANSISYAMYQDAALSQAWSSTDLKSATSDVNGFGGSFTIYGQIPVQTSVPAGSYAQALNAVVSF